jgi:hypothetical protein
MAGKRPCRVCGKWFQPHPRAGKRQRTCGREECGRERHRRACAAWHEQHPDYDRERRLRERLRSEVGVVGEALSRDPLAEIAWDSARDAVGLEASVIVEEVGKVLVFWARDAVHQQGAVITRKLAQVLARPARDEIATGTGPP